MKKQTREQKKQELKHKKVERRKNMKNFFIGIIVGIVLATTGTYAVIEQKAKKAATKENAEKVTKAAQNFTDTIKSVFE